MKMLKGSKHPVTTADILARWRYKAGVRAKYLGQTGENGIQVCPTGQVSLISLGKFW